MTKTGIRSFAILIAAACGIVFSGAATAQEKLTVWWVKGFYKSEDAALFAAIKKYEDKTGVKVDLSQYAVQDMIPKTVSALDAGTPPDVAYADVYDFQVVGMSDSLNPACCSMSIQYWTCMVCCFNGNA